MEIKLNFINQVAHKPNLNVVIFQKNGASFDGSAVAWKVLKNTSGGWGTQFDFSTDFHVSIRDADGAPTERLAAKMGEKFIVEETASGLKLTGAGSASEPTNIEILNDLKTQRIDAQIFKNEELLGTMNGGGPGQVATFNFNETIFIGSAGSINQGQIMDEGMVNGFNSEISLKGIKSADIVMSNPEGEPFDFKLENVVSAKKNN